MKQSKQTTFDRSAWWDMLSPPSPTATAVATLLYLFAGIALALSDDRTVSLLFLLCCAVFYFAMSRAFVPLLYYAIPAVLLFVCSALLPVENAFLLPTAFLSLTVGGGCGAFLILHRRNPKKDWPAALLPILPFLAVFLITGDPRRTLLTLLPLALAIVAGVMILRFTQRTAATLWIAAVLGATLAGAGIVTLAVCGMLTENPVALVADFMRARIVLLFEEMQTLYAETGVLLGLSEVDVSNAAVMFTNLLPGFSLALLAITAFLVWRTLLQMMLAFGTLKQIPLRLSGLTISPVCAILYLFCYLVSLVSGTEGLSLFSTVCENLLIAIIPALSLAGLASLIGKGGQHSCLSRLLLLAILLYLWINPLSALSLAAALGALNILLARFLPHGNKGEK